MLFRSGAFRNLVRPWFDRVFRVQPQAFRIEQARTVLKTGNTVAFDISFIKYIESNTIGYKNPVEHLKYDIQRDFCFSISQIICDYLQ